MEGVKSCRTCKLEKPLERFSPKQGTCKDCRNTKKREEYKEKGLHPINYKRYEEGKPIPSQCVLNDEQFKQFHKLKWGDGHSMNTHREALKLMNLI